MFLSFAPLEGITNHTYRRLHREHFGGADAYYAPFLAPDGSGQCKDSTLRDLLPELNPQGLPVPQILCNKAEAFLVVARLLRDMGYEEVNLNAGCPSGTVVPKHKGAGMLLDLRSLDEFLAEVFAHCPLRLSVKTRLGVESTDEFPEVLEIYNRYPLSELIIHARDRAGMYKSPVDSAAFARAFPQSRCPVCYNGDVFSPAHRERLQEQVPGLNRFMLGRGAVANPALFRQLRGGRAGEKQEMRDFHDHLLQCYREEGLSDFFAVGRMKELWNYMSHLYPDSRKALKRIYKSRSLSDYQSAAADFFSTAVYDSGRYFTIEGAYGN